MEQQVATFLTGQTTDSHDVAEGVYLAQVFKRGASMGVACHGAVLAHLCGALVEQGCW